MEKTSGDWMVTNHTEKCGGGTVSLETESAQKHGSSVSLREVLEADCRLEASAYAVEGRLAVETMRRPAFRLIPIFGPDGFCEQGHNAFRFRRIFVSRERGVPFFSGSDIINLDTNTDRYLSRTLTKQLDMLLIKKWDVLISCSGTIGNVALAGRRITGFALSQDVIRIRSTDPETAGYVAAFLRSSFGRPQLLQATYGSVIVHIEPHHLTRVLIPDIHPIRRTAIGQLMVEACELRDQANELIDKADEILHQRLRLPPLTAESADAANRMISIVRAKNLDGRLDAAYHDPTALSALSTLQNLGLELTTLSDPNVAKEIRPITKFRKRVYVARGGIPMLSSKQLFQVDPIDIKRLAKGAHTKDLPEIRLEKNMIAITRSGTIGRIQIIPAYMDGWTASEHATRVIANPIFKVGYLYAWLASDYGQSLIKRHSYGSVILEIDKEMLGSVPVPLPRAEVMAEIGDLVLKANDMRTQAWRKEREAIGDLEDLIGGKA